MGGGACRGRCVGRSRVSGNHFCDGAAGSKFHRHLQCSQESHTPGFPLPAGPTAQSCCRGARSRQPAPPACHYRPAPLPLPLPPLPPPPAAFAEKFVAALEWGATDCVNPKDHDKPIQQVTHALCTSPALPWTHLRLGASVRAAFGQPARTMHPCTLCWQVLSGRRVPLGGARSAPPAWPTLL